MSEKLFLVSKSLILHYQVRVNGYLWSIALAGIYSIPYPIPLDNLSQE